MSLLCLLVQNPVRRELKPVIKAMEETSIIKQLCKKFIVHFIAHVFGKMFHKV